MAVIAKPTDYMNFVYLLSGCLDTIAITISTADQIDLLC